MKTIIVSPQGQITIPVSLRESLNLQPGVELLAEVVDWVKRKALVITTRPKKLSDYTLGLGEEIWQNTDADNYIKSERKAWNKKYD